MPLRFYAFIGLFILSLSAQASSPNKADLVVVTKSTLQLAVFKKGRLLKQFHIALGGNPIGPKRKKGDKRTPEGRYLLDYKKSDSAYYRAIHISYPNDDDLRQSQLNGQDPGGQIMIHGQDPNSSISARKRQKFNWTDGCIALTNKDIDELWQLLDAGTPIVIHP
ncbi:L,D-transpeptidase family protein [Shewanella surugensis]|uniref:L,D-transpeptidase family protein n=1 Tax=Shewanella surugensis TaxID=212020 RepID=A0ABT0L9E7_9GAMM|nr:L,D-transpeptidase family protein [Shewanella surugensis]MCL1124338.1 L,D-transpeptidase family protein [Shewanella surugensis]